MAQNIAKSLHESTVEELPPGEAPIISIFTGHYGSGKTEVAVNTAINMTSQYKENVLIDIDVVNPFYRSSELQSVLIDAGIHLIAPNFAFSNMDLPSLPPEIQGVFSKTGAHIVFDVGGDENGAKVLGVFNSYFKEHPYNMYLVINTRRHLTQTKEQVLDMIEQIEKTSRLKITHLVPNTNLGAQTSIEHVLEGIEIGTQVSRETGIPIAFIGVLDTLISEELETLIKTEYDIDMITRPIKRYLTHWHGRS
jgi:hypothetical protein